jgi:hypothetical protein
MIAYLLSVYAMLLDFKNLSQIEENFKKIDKSELENLKVEVITCR